MKLFCLLFLVGVINTLASLTAPNISLQNVDSEWKLTWEPVQSSDKSDPIVGYKVNVTIYTLKDKNLPDSKRIYFLEQTFVLEKDQNELKVNIEPTVPYDFTVTAYTKSGEGPPSKVESLYVPLD